MSTPEYSGWDQSERPSYPCFRQRKGRLVALVAPFDGTCWGWSLWLDHKDGSQLLEGTSSWMMTPDQAIALAEIAMSDYLRKHDPIRN